MYSNYYFKNLSNLSGLQGLEWLIMDRTWVVVFCLGLNPSPESIGIPKFSGVSEIDDFRQDKAENSDKIWMLNCSEWYFHICTLDLCPNICALEVDMGQIMCIRGEIFDTYCGFSSLLWSQWNANSLHRFILQWNANLNK